MKSKEREFFEFIDLLSSNHSTVHALILIVDKIQKAIESKNYACGVFKDLCKAFNTLDHQSYLINWNIMELGVMHINGSLPFYLIGVSL